MRLVLDATKLNQHIKPYKFRMTTASQVRHALRKGCYIASVDLKDAYWHVPIHKRLRKFLAFAVGDRVYQFKVMPFGLNIAPRVFTKIMKPVAAKLQKLGMNIVMYLDDWLVIATTRRQCRMMVKETLRVGRSMGLLFNLKKSHLEPTKNLEWLGFLWDTEKSTLSLSEDNCRRTWRKLFKAVNCKRMTRRQWESLVGSLNHAVQVIPFARIKLKRLIMEGHKTFKTMNRDLPIKFPRVLRSLLRWWAKDTRLKSVSQWTQESPTMTLTTDASDWGWGYQTSAGHQGSGQWEGKWQTTHINGRELRAVHLALRLEDALREMTIHVLSDNTATVHCINRQGSTRSPTLLKISEDLFRLVKRRKLHLQAAHLEGKQNQWADALSRQSSASVEWELKQEEFDKLTQRFGMPNVDLFASEFNHKTEKFVTRCKATPTAGPDAMSLDWNQWEYIYLFPPPNTTLMMRVISHLKDFQGKVLLIAPKWESQIWSHDLMRWCPEPVPLPLQALEGEISTQLMSSLRLHAWSFYVGR